MLTKSILRHVECTKKNLLISFLSPQENNSRRRAERNICRSSFRTAQARAEQKENEEEERIYQTKESRLNYNCFSMYQSINRLFICIRILTEVSVTPK